MRCVANTQSLAANDATQLVEQPALDVKRFGERVDREGSGGRDGRRHDRGGRGKTLCSKAIPVPHCAEIEPLDMTFLINALPVAARVSHEIRGRNSLPTWRKLPGAVSTSST
jgi:hypothetical protein